MTERDGVCATFPHLVHWAGAFLATILALVLAGESHIFAGAAQAVPLVGSNSAAAVTSYTYDSVGTVAAASTTAARAPHQTTEGGDKGGPRASVLAAEDGLMAGSGPGRGVLEVSSQVRSTAAVRSFNPASAREFVFDPANERFVVGQSEKGFGHYGLAQEIGADENTVVGGMLSRGPNGEFFTDEMSGHYGINWTDEVRQQFVDFMRSYGFDIQHTMWGAGG